MCFFSVAFKFHKFDTILLKGSKIWFCCNLLSEVEAKEVSKFAGVYSVRSGECRKSEVHYC